MPTKKAFPAQPQVQTAGGVNLTFVNGSDPRMGGFGSGGFNMGGFDPGFRGVSTANGEGESALYSKPIKPRAPYKSFPKISDFLRKLDKEYDDPPRNFSQYIGVLTDDETIGFGRIHEVIVTAYDSKSPKKGSKSAPSGAWLRDLIQEDSNMKISRGSSSLMFKAIYEEYCRIEEKWAMENGHGSNDDIAMDDDDDIGSA